MSETDWHISAWWWKLSSVVNEAETLSWNLNFTHTYCIFTPCYTYHYHYFLLFQSFKLRVRSEGKYFCFTWKDSDWRSDHFTKWHFRDTPYCETASANTEDGNCYDVLYTFTRQLSVQHILDWILAKTGHSYMLYLDTEVKYKYLSAFLC